MIFSLGEFVYGCVYGFMFYMGVHLGRSQSLTLFLLPLLQWSL